MIKSDAYCSYCKERKPEDFGNRFGPHDSGFMCLDCCIKEQFLRLQSNLDHLSRLTENKKRLSKMLDEGFENAR